MLVFQVSFCYRSAKNPRGVNYEKGNRDRERQGGAAGGALLATSGLVRVTLPEKNNITGGRFRTHIREGFHVDVGFHGIADREKGRIGAVLRRIGRFEKVKRHYTYTAKPGPVYIDKDQKLKLRGN